MPSNNDGNIAFQTELSSAYTLSHDGWIAGNAVVQPPAACAKEPDY